MTVLQTNLKPGRGSKTLGANMNLQVSNPAAAYRRPVHADAKPGPATDSIVRTLFAAHSALGKLPGPEQATLLERSRIRSLARHEVVYREGDPANTAYFILSGYMKLSKVTADGGEVFLGIASALDCAGEMAVLQKRPYESDLTALSACRLLAVDARQFRQVFERQPDGLLAIMRLADERFLRVAEQLGDHYTLTAPGRIAKTLLSLAGLSTPGRNVGLALRLSQCDLGMMTKVSRESVNRQLRAWRAAGWIGMSGGAVTSVRADILSEIAGHAGGNTESRRASA